MHNSRHRDGAFWTLSEDKGEEVDGVGAKALENREVMRGGKNGSNL